MKIMLSLLIATICFSGGVAHAKYKYEKDPVYWSAGDELIAKVTEFSTCYDTKIQPIKDTLHRTHGLLDYCSRRGDGFARMGYLCVERAVVQIATVFKNFFPDQKDQFAVLPLTPLNCRVEPGGSYTGISESTYSHNCVINAANIAWGNYETILNDDWSVKYCGYPRYALSDTGIFRTCVIRFLDTVRSQNNAEATKQAAEALKLCTK